MVLRVRAVRRQRARRHLERRVVEENCAAVTVGIGVINVAVHERQVDEVHLRPRRYIENPPVGCALPREAEPVAVPVDGEAGRVPNREAPARSDVDVLQQHDVGVRGNRRFQLAGVAHLHCRHCGGRRRRYKQGAA